MSKVHWEDADIRFYVDDEEHGPFTAVSFDAQTVMEHHSNKYQGRTTPSKDSTYNGERGSIEFILESGVEKIRAVYEAFKRGVVNRTPEGRVVITAAKRFGDGSTEALRYENCQVNYSERGGENTPWRVTMAFEAENGVPI